MLALPGKMLKKQETRRDSNSPTSTLTAAPAKQSIKEENKASGAAQIDRRPISGVRARPSANTNLRASHDNHPSNNLVGQQARVAAVLFALGGQNTKPNPGALRRQIAEKKEYCCCSAAPRVFMAAPVNSETTAEQQHNNYDNNMPGGVTSGSLGFSCANYCSLPRRLNDLQQRELALQKNLQQVPCNWNYDQLDFENPAAYLRTIKKTSVDSRLRHCVNSPLGHRTQFNISPYQLGCADSTAVTFRRHNGHNFYRNQCHPHHQQADTSSSNNSMCYEMSTDLLQKQLELLCRRYGGVQRAVRAARIIQRAYRQHALARNFERVRKRRSGTAMLVNKVSGHTTNIGQKMSSGTHFVSKICITGDSMASEPEIETSGMSNDSRPIRFKMPISGFGKRPTLDDFNDAFNTRQTRNNDECRLFFFGSNESTTNLFEGSAASSTDTVIENNTYSKPGCSSNLQHHHHDQYVSYVKISGNEEAMENDNYRANFTTEAAALKPHNFQANQSSGRTRAEALINSQKTTLVFDGEQEQSIQSANLQQRFSPSINGVVKQQMVEISTAATTKGPSFFLNNEGNQKHLHKEEYERRTGVHNNLNVANACCPNLASNKTMPCFLTSPVLDRKLLDSGERKNSLSKFLQSPVWPRKKYSNSSNPEVVAPPQFMVSTSNASVKNGSEKSPGDKTKVKINSNPESDNNAAVKYYRLSSNRMEDLIRRRQYRIALNFFNKKPERGVDFLISWGFVEQSAEALARFLLTRKGLSKQMIGEYLGNLQNKFSQKVLGCFVEQIDMSNMHIDVALRIFQSYFRLPGEAQKIERIVEIFANRYCKCNPEIVSNFHQTDTVFILAFAIIMLNTDLHSPNVKSSKRMKLEDFVKNLRGIDAGNNVDSSFLSEMYTRVKCDEFKSDPDHVTQVLKVESTINGKKPTLSLPHRRLVCFCRLNELVDHSKKQSPGAHQREIFLFNDMLLITKILSRKKSGIVYSYRESHCLVGAQINPFTNQYYSNGVEVNFTLENKKLYFNTRTAEDQTRFIEDLKEATHETDEMEALRIELELQKQTGIIYPIRHLIRQDRRIGVSQPNAYLSANNDPPNGKRDSDRGSALFDGSASDPSVIHRHSSATSLDSGMSSASLCSRESFQQIQASATLSQIQEVPLPPSAVPTGSKPDRAEF